MITNDKINNEIWKEYNSNIKSQEFLLNRPKIELNTDLHSGKEKNKINPKVLLEPLCESCSRGENASVSSSRLRIINVKELKDNGKFKLRNILSQKNIPKQDREDTNNENPTNNDPEVDTNNEKSENCWQHEEPATISTNNVKEVEERLNEHESSKESGDEGYESPPGFPNRYSVENEMIYLGDGKFYDEFLWNTVIAKKFEKRSMVLRNIVSIFWPKNVLQCRCLNKSKIRKNTKKAVGDVKILTPRKLKVVFDLYEHYIQKKGINSSKRIEFLKKEGRHTITNLLRDIRKNVKKKLTFN